MLGRWVGLWLILIVLKSSLWYTFWIWTIIWFLLMDIASLVVIYSAKVSWSFLIIDGSGQFSLNLVRGSTKNSWWLIKFWGTGTWMESQWNLWVSWWTNDTSFGMSNSRKVNVTFIMVSNNLLWVIDCYLVWHDKWHSC